MEVMKEEGGRRRAGGRRDPLSCPGVLSAHASSTSSGLPPATLPCMPPNELLSALTPCLYTSQAVLRQLHPGPLDKETERLKSVGVRMHS